MTPPTTPAIVARVRPLLRTQPRTFSEDNILISCTPLEKIIKVYKKICLYKTQERKREREREREGGDLEF